MSGKAKTQLNEWMQANASKYKTAYALAKGYQAMRGSTADPGGRTREAARAAFGLEPDAAKAKRVPAAPASTPAAKTPAGLTTEKSSDIVAREILDPVAVVVKTCVGMPDGELASSESLRQYLGISKAAWSDVEHDPQLTSFRCMVPRHGSTSHAVYFGNDREISKMKRKKGVK